MATALGDLAAISTIVQAVVVVGAIVFTIVQLIEAARARELTSLSQVFQEMHTVESDDRRDRVLNLPRDMAEWTPAQWRDARSECAHFQQIGFYVRHRFIRKVLVLEMYSLLILDLWRTLAPFVLHEQSRIGAPRYARDFKALAEDARAYRLKKGLPIDGQVLSQSYTD
jgi:hypothetical protein